MSDDRDESTEAPEPLVFAPSKVWLAGQRKRWYVMGLASAVIAPMLYWVGLPGDVFWLKLASVLIVLGVLLLVLRVIAVRHLRAQRVIVWHDRLEVRARWLGERMAFSDVVVVVCGEDSEGQIRSLELWNSLKCWNLKVCPRRIRLTGYEDMPRMWEAIEPHLPAAVVRRSRRARGEAADFRWFVWLAVGFTLLSVAAIVVMGLR